MAEQTKAVQVYSNDQLALIKKPVAHGVSDDELKLFIEVCKSKGLNPFTRQIYAIARKDGDNGKKMTIQTGIDGYRFLGASSGKYAGQLGPEWCGKNGKWVDVWLESEPPMAARVAALHRDFKQPLWRVAKYASYVQAYNSKPTPLWAKMPEVMLAKCAEALALRAAFPEELSGIYTKEEMMQADTEPADLPATVLAQETIEGEVVEETQANGHQDTDKSTVAVTRGDLYTRGEEKGLWSRTSPDKFYAWASSISARTESKKAWDMTVSEMGEMAKRIYAEPEVKKASAGAGK